MLRAVLFNDLYTAIIVVSLASIVTAKALKPQRFTALLKLVGNSNYLRIHLKDHKFLDPFDIILFLNFCINGMLTSLLTYQDYVKKTISGVRSCYTSKDFNRTGSWHFI
jgi:tetraacyldisaccharide-1-P 4'-kinase